MKIIISGKNIEITEALRERAMQKISKLEKFFNAETEAKVTMSVEKNRHIVEVTIPFNGVVLRAEKSNGDMYASLDKVVDILMGQVRKNKTKLSKNMHETFLKGDPLFFSNGDDFDDDEYKIVRSKKFAIKPMVVDEAILQMNLLGHEFFMFSNSETREVNVVYRRKDGNYGLIEPKF